MNSQGPTVEVVSPWGSASLTTEEDLRAAQEYFFQTHATQSWMIAEGRNAQGFMKSYTRRKLEKEMGEDFKMYTGQELGEGAPGEESQGIRGELNDLLRFVYQRIANDQPIVSPLQEDVTILRHPHGALEVCFGMVFFYGSLMKKHLTLASNRRKVLKSILDEELFKWIWRLSVNYLLSDTASRIHLEDHYLTAGLPYVPAERQRATMPQKIFEIGQFMLGKSLQDSHLRFRLAYYFVMYLRTMQSEVLAQPGMADPEEIYAEVMHRKQLDPINHVLVAIDVLMNMVGNSSQSFDDILGDEQREIEGSIPPLEAQFIRHFDPYADMEAFGDAVRQALFAAQKSELVDQRGANSLAMRLLLMLRALTPSIRTGILDQIPPPVLVMLRNRIVNGPQDDGTRRLSERIKAALEVHAQRGEKLVVPPAQREGMTGVAPLKPGTPSRAEASTAGQDEGAAGSAGKPAHGTPAPPPAAGASTAPRPRAPAAAAPAAAQPPAAPAAAATAAARPAAPSPAEPKPASPAQAEGMPAPDALLEQRLLLHWRQDGGKFTLLGLTPRELLGLVGPEPRLVLPWVMLALQTGQVFHVPAASVNKEWIEKLVKTVLAKAAGLPPARLGKPQAAQLANELKDTPPQKALLTLIAKGQLGDIARSPDRAPGALESLLTKFGATLGEFLRSPSSVEFRNLRVGLSGEEKELVQVLQKLSRLGGQ